MLCRTRLSSQRGVSLVETMVALLVMAVGLAGVYRAFPQGLATGRHALERTQASLLAEGKLEQLRAQGFETLAAAASSNSSPKPFANSIQHPVFSRFRWQTEVARRAEDLLEIHLRVTWPWPRQAHHLSFTTYVSKR